MAVLSLYVKNNYTKKERERERERKKNKMIILL